MDSDGFVVEPGLVVEDFTVTAGIPEIDVSVTELSAIVDEGETGSQSFTITNAGTGDLNYSIAVAHSGYGSATALFTEDFETGSDGWLMMDNYAGFGADGADAWQLTSEGYAGYWSFDEHTTCMVNNDDAVDTNCDDLLYTENTIDISTANEAVVNFTAATDDGDCYLLVSSDGFVTYDGFLIPNTSGAWADYSVNITGLADVVQIGFLYLYNGWGYGMAIDDVSVYSYEPYSWLSVDPNQGSLTSETAVDILAMFDATDLEVGDYSAEAIISSNAGDDVTIPVSLTVETSTVNVTADHLLGWNMVSLPVVVEDASPEALYTDALEGTLYGYPYGDPLSALVNGEGYWLRFSAEGSDMLAGDYTDDVTVSMIEGWNMIGSVSESAGIDDPSGIVIEGTLYGYPYGDPETSIEPGNGYWVRTSAAGDVTVSTSALGGLARVSEPVANMLNINGMKLYFGMDMNEKDALSYSMPPKPPTGAFDVRFAGDMKAIGESGMIHIQSADHLSISWNVTQEAGDHMQWVLTSTRGEDIELSGSGSIELAGNISGFTLNKVAEIPEQFMLAQNFPNPFNPVTSIEYALPEESFVKISIYNVMGQKVTDLVSDVMPGGYHSVVWNSTNLRGEQVSSGIYLYTIEAEGFTSVKKMVLMK